MVLHDNIRKYLESNLSMPRLRDFYHTFILQGVMILSSRNSAITKNNNTTNNKVKQNFLFHQILPETFDVHILGLNFALTVSHHLLQKQNYDHQTSGNLLPNYGNIEIKEPPVELYIMTPS